MRATKAQISLRMRRLIWAFVTACKIRAFLPPSRINGYCTSFEQTENILIRRLRSVGLSAIRCSHMTLRNFFSRCGSNVLRHKGKPLLCRMQIMKSQLCLRMSVFWSRSSLSVLTILSLRRARNPDRTLTQMRRLV